MFFIKTSERLINKQRPRLYRNLGITSAPLSPNEADEKEKIDSCLLDLKRVIQDHLFLKFMHKFVIYISLASGFVISLCTIYYKSEHSVLISAVLTLLVYLFGFFIIMIRKAFSRFAFKLITSEKNNQDLLYEIYLTLRENETINEVFETYCKKILAL